MLFNSNDKNIERPHKANPTQNDSLNESSNLPTFPADEVLAFLERVRAREVHVDQYLLSTEQALIKYLDTIGAFHRLHDSSKLHLSNEGYRLLDQLSIHDDSNALAVQAVEVQPGPSGPKLVATRPLETRDIELKYLVRANKKKSTVSFLIPKGLKATEIIREVNQACLLSEKHDNCVTGANLLPLLEDEPSNKAKSEDREITVCGAVPGTTWGIADKALLWLHGYRESTAAEACVAAALFYFATGSSIFRHTNGDCDGKIIYHTHEGLTFSAYLGYFESCAAIGTKK